MAVWCMKFHSKKPARTPSFTSRRMERCFQTLATILNFSPDSLFAARARIAPRGNSLAFRFAWLVVLSGTLAGCARRDTVQAYPYVHPLASPGAKFAGLPPAVQSTVRAQAGAAELYDIRNAGFPDQDAYEILF